LDSYGIIGATGCGAEAQAQIVQENTPKIISFKFDIMA
jgi:hypothetical protein